MGLGNGFRCQHELILHFTFGSPEYFDRGTPNVIRASRVGDNREHQTQKPVDLIGRLVGVVAKRGGVVLDTFMGSGTTLLAAKSMGRNAIGIETEERYCEIAAKRLAQETIDFGDLG